MFEKNYKNAMNSITPEPEVKEKILDRIILKEELKKRKNPATPWRVAFACVAVVAMVLGIVFVPRNKITTQNNTFQTLKTAKSYSEIYNLIAPKKSLSAWLNSYGARDGESIEYENETAVIEDSLEKGNSGENTSATDGTTTTDDNANDFSQTTEQVDGVSEADIVKTDGEYIYALFDKKLSVYKADGENSVLLSTTQLSKDEYGNFNDMFLKDDRLVILKPYDCPIAAEVEKDLETETDEKNTQGTASASSYAGTNVVADVDYNTSDLYVTVLIYDVSNPQSPKLISQLSQEGYYNSSRMVGEYIYLVSESYITVDAIDKNEPSTFVPTTVINGTCTPVPAESVYSYSSQATYEKSYTVICAYNCTDGKMTDTVSLLGGSDNLYCSKDNIILANSDYSATYNDTTTDSSSQFNTVVSRLEISEGKIEYKTTGKIDGILDNQFYIDEYNGYFRFVTTVTKSTQTTQKFANTDEEIVSYSSETYAQLTITDENLETVGKIENLAEGESVYSVRFMGDIAYFVTFRQTDPLFSADLSDPHNPKILGELKISGFSEYMYPYGDGLLLGFGMEANENTGRTTFLKLSMFDVSNPENVTEQDKTVLEGYTYSDALYNHKAMLVSKSKNLVGFTAYDTYGNFKYMVYEHKDGTFNRLAVLETPLDSNGNSLYGDIRGLFINDDFYLVSQNGLQVFDINTFLQTAMIES